jgi:hypothetical protein
VKFFVDVPRIVRNKTKNDWGFDTPDIALLPKSRSGFLSIKKHEGAGLIHTLQVSSVRDNRIISKQKARGRASVLQSTWQRFHSHDERRIVHLSTAAASPGMCEVKRDDLRLDVHRNVSSSAVGAHGTAILREEFSVLVQYVRALIFTYYSMFCCCF